MKFVFIGGMGRSGTSLLRAILDSHPNIASGPEFDPLHEMLNLFRETKAKIANNRIDSYVNLEESRGIFRNLFSDLLGNYAKKEIKRSL